MAGLLDPVCHFMGGNGLPVVAVEPAGNIEMRVECAAFGVYLKCRVDRVNLIKGFAPKCHLARIGAALMPGHHKRGQMALAVGPMRNHRRLLHRRVCHQRRFNFTQFNPKAT